jgi:N-acylneuraminate cytidylyltransferase
MSNVKKIIAVITAREGSKGVINKNLREVAGMSLVGRAIYAAINAKIFDKVILTTDGIKIAEEGEKLGAEVVFRPSELSGDSSKSIDAVVHAITQTGINEGIVVLLQPTSPLRKSKHIIEAVDKFKSSEAASLVSVCESEHHPYKTFILESDELEVIKDIRYLDMPRQEMPKSYRLNGAVFVNSIDELIAKKSFYNLPIEVYEMDAQSSIDIDSELDLKIANILIEEGKDE